jgi:NDP-sugar pyrophosphorylase family protein
VTGRHVAVYDKARAAAVEFDHIDYGAIALRKEVVGGLPPEKALDIAPVLSDLAARGKLLAHRVERRFFEIGSPKGIADLEDYLSRKNEAGT